MMKVYGRLIRPLVILFLLVTALVIIFNATLAGANINASVVFAANTLLFAATVINIYFQYRNISNANPNAVIRGVMAGMFLKLFGLAAAVLIYLFASGTNRSINAVFLGMALYIVYTWMEVRISLRLNPKK